MLQALIDLRWHVYDGLLVQAFLTGMLASRGYAVTCCLRRLPSMFVVSRFSACTKLHSLIPVQQQQHQQQQQQLRNTYVYNMYIYIYILGI